ncbi:MAG: nucleoside triphosphate pyrophosphohydrolase [Spirochaetales bacterium]|nr:nucleoside triphosphate pyrophosphohydrolase [Spirochaetales bacterium]
MVDENNNRITAQEAFMRLYGIVKRLRGPDGCPWDRKQSASTLRKSLIEEAYESIDAIECDDDENLKEELGDLFLVILMMIRIKEENRKFTLTDVLGDISEKLIRRHPHVFGDEKVGSADEVIVKWEEIKTTVEGKNRTPHLLDSIPRALPPLEKAAAIQKKVSKVGFDWTETAPVFGKLEEEIDELHRAVKTGGIRQTEEEIGDILFTVVNLARLMKIDPSLALNRTNNKFTARFMEIEKRLIEKGIPLEEAGLALMDRLWNEIKKR